jgi:hypothetical protein
MKHGHRIFFRFGMSWRQTHVNVRHRHKAATAIYYHTALCYFLKLLSVSIYQYLYFVRCSFLCPWFIKIMNGVYMNELRIPVPIVEFEIWIFCVLVTWIPSVFGLSSGDVTVRPETLTFAEFWNWTWICWPFFIVKSSNTKLLHLYKVSAYKVKLP